MRRPQVSSSRAFTLVELLAVVTIVGILAVIAVASFRKRMLGSRSTEAFAMVQSIRSAEDRYKAENLTYLDVSAAGWFPAAPAGRVKRAFYDTGHADFANWRLLNPTVIGPVEFGYRVNAGAPGVAMTAPAIAVTGLTWPNPTTEYWYVIQAAADADQDGVFAYFLSSSMKADVYQQNDGE